MKEVHLKVLFVLLVASNEITGQLVAPVQTRRLVLPIYPTGIKDYCSIQKKTTLLWGRM